MINIGESIADAIDWTQDFLKTTRPIAEQTLFSLMAGSAVKEEDDGFVLVEAEEEVERHFRHQKGKQFKNRVRFHQKRKTTKQRYNSKMKHMKFDNNGAADAMMAADEDDDE